MDSIRKISVGADYKSSAMHYIVEQKVLNNQYTIHHIQRDEIKKSYKVYIIRSNQEVVLWKEFNESMPVSVEYNINF
tara:strand:+ start:3377 stop:3607 length:231 start_codon:yes stop_codon:yes gene_type:complete